MKIVDDSEKMKQPYDDDENYVSKSALKRESTAAQALGQQLLSLSQSQLQRVPLSENLLDALALAKRIKVNTDAHRRQIQYIGRLMRDEELEPIKEALKKVLSRSGHVAAQVQIIEKMRDKLLTEGDGAIQALLDEHPHLERQKLRQLVRQANKELAKGPDSKAAKELFQYLRQETV
ncbi:ribosome biogenesis factor YjgA [Shewanella sp. YIC-542]|uniref:ribosome biogenesis factor YjgA n=1 Tax=Shewanella mytili TaxID=3377111 RepID=UPI00398E41FC